MATAKKEAPVMVDTETGVVTGIVMPIPTLKEKMWLIMLVNRDTK